MKIGLLSFHNAANYGAALQAYALQKAIGDMGFESEYINYQNHHRKNSYSMSYHIVNSIKKKDLKGAIKYILGSPYMNLRKFKFKKFYEKNLLYTSKVFSTANEARSLNDKYNKFIVGSDQVWNSKNNGNDDAYLLSFVDDDSKKVSYSSSFGISEIPIEQKNIYSTYLSRIAYLSVREQYGVELVKELTNREAKLVLDPVFLLTKDTWLNMAISKKHQKPFVFSYTNQPNQLETFLTTTGYNIENKLLYKISRSIKVSDFISRKVRVKYSISPIEFLSIIRDSSLIVSASFHCIVLSIILNKPFVAILSGNTGRDERLINILSMLGLEKRIFNDSMTKNDVIAEIDYESVNIKIYDLKESSISFLSNALNS